MLTPVLPAHVGNAVSKDSRYAPFVIGATFHEEGTVESAAHASAVTKQPHPTTPAIATRFNHLLVDIISVVSK
jgi:hypothetical protein